MKQVLESNVRCIILTSGTLSPLPALVSELRIPVAVTLENSHVIGPGQVFVSNVTDSPDRTPLNSPFSTRNDLKYIASFGNTKILNECRVAPHGVLVFLSSYPIISNSVDQWQSTVI
ncbi:Regulator of telomere elongation helicase 1 [Blattella germanica]|nr:Regulator of telomere elongation helicase 1 [Blattella germanica]